MSLIFKSKLYREEIKHWALIATLFMTTLTMSVLLLRSQPKTVLLSLDQNGVRVVTDSHDQALQYELKSFLKFFIEKYFNYDEKSFAEQVGLASDLMSDELWDEEKSKLFTLKTKLQSNPLTQRVEIESIDLVRENEAQALLSVFISSRLTTKSLKLKVILNFEPHLRSEKNPWGYQLVGVRDAIL